MERLTDSDWAAHAPRCACAQRDLCRGRPSACEDCLVLRAYIKLAHYEDTGLEPWEVDPRHRRPITAIVRRVAHE